MRSQLAVTLLLVFAAMVSQSEGGWWVRTREKLKDAVGGVLVGKAVGAVAGALGKRQAVTEEALNQAVWDALQRACTGYVFNTQVPPPKTVIFAFLEVDENKDRVLSDLEFADFADVAATLDLCQQAAVGI